MEETKTSKVLEVLKKICKVAKNVGNKIYNFIIGDIVRWVIIVCGVEVFVYILGKRVSAEHSAIQFLCITVLLLIYKYKKIIRGRINEKNSHKKDKGWGSI